MYTGKLPILFEPLSSTQQKTKNNYHQSQKNKQTYAMIIKNQKSQIY
jgi:hypothetical protein